MTHLALDESSEGLIDGSKQFQSLPGNPSDDYPPVLRAPLALNQMSSLETIQKARDIGVGRDHPGGGLRTSNAVFAGSAKNPQHVVLRRRQFKLAKKLGVSLVQVLMGAGKIQHRLLFEESEGFALLQLGC